jgi:hypothetical protein
MHGRNEWFKSSHSMSGNCVEILIDNGPVKVRDSKFPGGNVISTTQPQYLNFLTSIKNGEITRPLA